MSVRLLCVRSARGFAQQTSHSTHAHTLLYASRGVASPLVRFVCIPVGDLISANAARTVYSIHTPDDDVLLLCTHKRANMQPLFQQAIS